MSSPTSLPPPHPSSNASQIIIDVRGNGGGYVQAAYKAIRLLIGAAKVPDSDLTLPLDFVISTPYTENVIGVLAVDNTTAPHYYLGLYSDLNGTELASAFDYAPFRELRFTEAGRAGNYSAPFKFNHKGQLPVTEEQPVLGDRPFLVLSDGDCFSACAVLTHVLGKRHKVPMVTVGGLPNQPPDVSSSCLGFTLTEFYAVAHGLGKLAAMEPQQASLPLKVQGAVKMAFTSAYVDSEIPCEFEFLPSQHHVNYTVDLIAKPWAMWNEVAKLFDPTAAYFEARPAKSNSPFTSSTSLAALPAPHSKATAGLASPFHVTAWCLSHSLLPSHLPLPLPPLLPFSPSPHNATSISPMPLIRPPPLPSFPLLLPHHCPGASGGGRKRARGEGRGAGGGRCLNPRPRRDIARVSLQSAEDSWCASTGAGLSGVAGDYGGSGSGNGGRGSGGNRVLRLLPIMLVDMRAAKLQVARSTGGDNSSMAAVQPPPWGGGKRRGGVGALQATNEAP
ncbi:unnamed protein product [Closterium sp. NIES-54]